MDGRNSSPSVFIFLIIVIIIFLYALLDTITSTGQKAHGKVVEKRHQQQSVEKLQTPVMRTPSKYGEMDIRPDHSSTLTNVLRQPEDSWIQTVTEPINIGSEEMVTINQLVDIAAEIAGKKITKDHVDALLVFVVVTQTMI